MAFIGPPKSFEVVVGYEGCFEWLEYKVVVFVMFVENDARRMIHNFD